MDIIIYALETILLQRNFKKKLITYAHTIPHVLCIFTVIGNV